MQHKNLVAFAVLLLVSSFSAHASRTPSMPSPSMVSKGTDMMRMGRDKTYAMLDNKDVNRVSNACVLMAVGYYLYNHGPELLKQTRTLAKNLTERKAMPVRGGACGAASHCAADRA